MRKMVSCGLVVAMVAMGMPAGVYAAGKAPAARQDQQTGTVKGQVKDARCRTLAGTTVRVRNASTGAVAAEVLSDASGWFVAAGLAPASYVVEVLSTAGQVTASSPAIAVAAGTTAIVTVTATAAGAVAPAARQDQQTGSVVGEAKDARGTELAGTKVRVRNTSTGAIAAEVLSDACGGFVAAGLAPGNYVVEIVGAAGQVIGLSPAIVVVAGTTATITVTTTAVGAVAAAAAGGGGLSLMGLGTAATVGLLAAIAIGTIVAVRAARHDASPSS